MIFHTFYTTDLPAFVLADHQACCEKIGIEVIYHSHEPNQNFDVLYRAHGNLINELLENAKSNEIICILDIDCLPHNLEELNNAFRWVQNSKSFIGNAQNISHTKMKNRLYAAASMIMVHKQAWLTVGKPNMAFNKISDEESLIDTCQSLSLAADEVGFEYRLLMPKGYDDSQRSWQLGPYCAYGGGTTYPGTWHFFRISSLKHTRPKLWADRVNEILYSTFSDPTNPAFTVTYHKTMPWYKKLKMKTRSLIPWKRF